MNDEQLVQNAINGDQHSFETLVSKYERLIYSICYRMFNNNDDALDYTQETFIKVYKNMEKAIGKGSFKSWICTIARNTCLDELRRRSKKSTISLDAHYDNDESNAKMEIADTAPTPIDEILINEDSKLLKDAINSLSEENKAIIILRDVEGMAYDEIAEILDISIGTVKSRISRSRKKLQTIYLDLLQQSL